MLSVYERYKLKGKFEKHCTVCKTKKPVEEFSPSSKLFLSHRCKDCSRIQQEAMRRLKGVKEFRSRKGIGSIEEGFICRTCKIRKDISSFKIRRDGNRLVDYECRQCTSKRQYRKNITPRGRYTASKGSAKSRKIPFTLTFEEFTNLCSKPCHYCGFPINETGIGLDQLLCGKGYTIDNVVPCCWVCNQARNNVFTPDEMKIIGAVIAKIKQQRIDSGNPFPAKRNIGIRRPLEFNYKIETYSDASPKITSTSVIPPPEGTL